jgi:uncharacterized protein (TIRG00374 family)
LGARQTTAAEATGAATRGSGAWRACARIASVSVAVLLALVLLAYSLRGIEWREVGRIVAGAAPGRLLLAAGIATTAMLLRACRWRILLNAEGSVTILTAFRATAAGYFGNNFLPARGGELVRTFIISSRSGLDSAYVLATALSERAADAVALVAISALVLLTLPSPPGWLAAASRPFALLALVAVIGIGVLPFMGGFARTAVERSPLPATWRPRLLERIDQGLRGVRAFHDVRRFSGFAGLTVVIWCLDAAGTITVGSALGLRIPISVAFLLIAGLGLGSALPSTPGYVGIYQFVAVTVLTPFGFSRTDAIAYILVAQAMSYAVVGFWGSLGLFRFKKTTRR